MTGTLQSRVFYTFSALVVFLILAFTLLFYVVISETLKSRAFDSIFRLTGSISNQVDSKLQAMNTLTLNVLFSPTLVDLIHNTAVYDNNPFLFEDRSKMNELMYLISGVDYPLLQINIVGTNGNFYGFGYLNQWTNLRQENVLGNQHVQTALRLDGRRLIVPPHYDEWNITNKVVVSLLRSFPPVWGLPVDTVIELQLDYVKLTNLVEAAVRSPRSTSENELRTWIFDEDGNVVYPNPFGKPFDKPTAVAIWKGLKSQPAEVQTWSGRYPSGGTNILAKTTSEFSGWTVVVTESETKLLEPVLNVGFVILGSSVLVVVLALVLSWVVSRTITRPIKKIYESINNLRLETVHIQQPETMKSSINELEDLNSAFEEMHAKLKNSLNEIVASRSHEIHSRLLALQSQMNPHFLYNTMVNISIMAEEVGATEIVKACGDLSNMLRYISRDVNNKVTIAEELEHTRNYLDLMKTRYGSRFQYLIDVPDSMLAIEIPRLVIQPLAENALKYGIERDPPWNLTITGHLGEGWSVTVHDNGPGFEPGLLSRMNRELEMIDPPTSVPELELDGMGLANIFIRLKLHFEGEAVFKLENHPLGGAEVTVGGKVLSPSEGGTHV